MVGYLVSDGDEFGMDAAQRHRSDLTYQAIRRENSNQPPRQMPPHERLSWRHVSDG